MTTQISAYLPYLSYAPFLLPALTLASAGKKLFYSRIRLDGQQMLRSIYLQGNFNEFIQKHGIREVFFIEAKGGRYFVKGTQWSSKRAIFFPEGLDQVQPHFRAIMQHELMHIKHNDKARKHFMKAAAQIVTLVAFWFLAKPQNVIKGVASVLAAYLVGKVTEGVVVYRQEVAADKGALEDEKDPAVFRAALGCLRIQQRTIESGRPLSILQDCGSYITNMYRIRHILAMMVEKGIQCRPTQEDLRKEIEILNILWK